MAGSGSGSDSDCYCGMSELDILKLILEARIAQFDRLQQLIQAIETLEGI